LLPVLFTILGKQETCDNVVVGLEEVLNVTNQSRRRFGMASPFPILFQEAWREDAHIFAAEGGKATNNDTHRLGSPERVTADILNKYPVEVLAIEETAQSFKSKQRFWVKWLDKCHLTNQPNYVIILIPSKELVEADGLQSKPWGR
jgi:hypothetical protein